MLDCPRLNILGLGITLQLLPVIQEKIGHRPITHHMAEIRVPVDSVLGEIGATRPNLPWLSVLAEHKEFVVRNPGFRARRANSFDASLGDGDLVVSLRALGVIDYLYLGLVLACLGNRRKHLGLLKFIDRTIKLPLSVIGFTNELLLRLDQSPYKPVERRLANLLRVFVLE